MAANIKIIIERKSLNIKLTKERPIVIRFGKGSVAAIGGGVFKEESLHGTIDGSNKTYTTTQEFITGSTWVFINGLKQRLNIDYVESGNNSIEFTESPSNVSFDDELTIIYRIS
jgi:hypothetical protein